MSVPLPALVNVAEPNKVPPTSRTGVLTVKVKSCVTSTGAAPKLSEALPATAKSPAHVCAREPASVRALGVPFTSAPPKIVREPVPKAEALPKTSDPAVSVVPPE